MGSLFGTDGVRDVANVGLSPEVALKLGRAGVGVVRGEAGDGRRVRVLVGRDTRISGAMLTAALTAGFTSAGADVLDAGIIPTPAVAYLTKAYGADLGAVISASHNPVEYNGIKFFARDGYKLTDEQEEVVERAVLDGSGQVRVGVDDGLPRPRREGVGQVTVLDDAEQTYAAFLTSAVEVDLSGVRIVLDCANGAAFRVAPRVLRQLGAHVIVINAEPDGLNVNAGCGSTHPASMQKATVAYGADLGLSHDGDADRVIACDERGQLVDGDHIMTIVGLDLLKRGRLPHRSIVATVYSNLGLTRAFREAGGSVLTTKAGDRYVLEEMRRTGIALGGEQSGHIIWLEAATTGDGILTALLLLSVMRRTGARLSELRGQMVKLPQFMVNVRVRDKSRLESCRAVKACIEKAAASMDGEGRLLVRASGTEPLVRVMGEGPDADLVQRLVSEVVEVIQRELN